MGTIYLKKKKERIQKLKKTPGDSLYIYQNKLDKVCFQHAIAYGDFNNFPRKAASDKVLHDKAFNIAKHMMDIKGILLQ